MDVISLIMESEVIPQPNECFWSRKTGAVAHHFFTR